jgi:hypothetical protein
MDKAPAMFILAFAMGVMLFAGGCSGDDNWRGGLRMTVNWTHYKDASDLCNRINAIDENHPRSEPTHACFERKGSDCDVITDESARYDMFGKLVQICFEARQDEIERMK